MVTDDRLVELDTEACVAKAIVLTSAVIAGVICLILFSMDSELNTRREPKAHRRGTSSSKRS
mgnify:CR=1 FL=1